MPPHSSCTTPTVFISRFALSRGRLTSFASFAVPRPNSPLEFSPQTYALSLCVGASLMTGPLVAIFCFLITVVGAVAGRSSSRLRLFDGAGLEAALDAAFGAALGAALGAAFAAALALVAALGAAAALVALGRALLFSTGALMGLVAFFGAGFVTLEALGARAVVFFCTTFVLAFLGAMSSVACVRV